MVDGAKLQPKRKNVRYKAEPAESALLSFELQSRVFKGELAALIVDHSYHGCCLVLLRTDKVQVGAFCCVQLGTLAPMKAEVRWLELVGEELIKVGFFFP